VLAHMRASVIVMFRCAGCRIALSPGTETPGDSARLRVIRSINSIRAMIETGNALARITALVRVASS